MPSPQSRSTRLSVFTFVVFGLLLTSQLSFGYRGRSWLSPSNRQVSFGGHTTGSVDTMPEVLTNVGWYPVTISSASLSGSGFRLSGPSFPLSLEPGASVTLELIFAPTAATDYIGTLALAWGSYGRVLNLPVTGTGTGTGSISAVPSTLSFGSVAVGSNSAKTATLSATGASTVISAVTTTNPEFTVSGFALPLSLTAGQTVSFTVKFAPLSAGSASASLAFATDGTGPVTSQALTGAGSAVAAADHSVSVSWADSTSDVTGYNVYRGATSGGPYAKVNAAADAGNAYTDTTVAGGTTYYYVVTAVDSVGTESAYSPEVAATVPSP